MITTLFTIWVYGLLIVAVFGIPHWIDEVHGLGRKWRLYGYTDDRHTVKQMRRAVLLKPFAALVWPVSLFVVLGMLCAKSPAIKNIFTSIRVALIGR